MKKEASRIRAVARRVERLQEVADKLLGRIGEELSAAEAPGEKRYKEIADTLKVIRDIQMIRPEGGEREEENGVAIEVKGTEEGWIG